MKDYSGMCIFDLMKVPTKELKELTIEEFAKEIGKYNTVNIDSVSDKYCLKPSGDIYIHASNANIYIEECADGYRLFMYVNRGINRVRESSFHLHLSENIIYGIYSFENNKNYRISFEGNSHDLFISAWKIDDKKQIIQDDIRDLIRRYEYEKNYEPNNVEILTKTIEELKKLIRESEG